MSNHIKAPRPAFTAGEIGNILHDKYPCPRFVFFLELRAGTGYGGWAEQEIDAWCMDTWPSSGLLTIAFEIKVYRSDFLRELANPDKRAFALRVSNEFYFVAPKHLITPAELPAECGLMEVDMNGRIRTTFKAKHRICAAPPWLFVASLARRMCVAVGSG